MPLAALYKQAQALGNPGRRTGRPLRCACGHSPGRYRARAAPEVSRSGTQRCAEVGAVAARREDEPRSGPGGGRALS